MAEVTPATIQGKIDQHKPDLVILDYHQLFSDNKKSMGATERNMNISREFKMLAMTNNIPVIDITAATMDDVSDQDNPPMLSQVAWSKAISHLEDINVQVLTISKPIHPESIHRNFRFLARQHLAHQQSRTRRHGNAYHGMAAGNHSILKMRHLTQVRKAIRRTGS